MSLWSEDICDWLNCPYKSEPLPTTVGSCAFGRKSTYKLFDGTLHVDVEPVARELVAGIKGLYEYWFGNGGYIPNIMGVWLLLSDLWVLELLFAENSWFSDGNGFDLTCWSDNKLFTQDVLVLVHVHLSTSEREHAATWADFPGDFSLPKFDTILLTWCSGVYTPIVDLDTFLVGSWMVTEGTELETNACDWHNYCHNWKWKCVVLGKSLLLSTVNYM